jgi:hypothetical protein
MLYNVIMFSDNPPIFNPYAPIYYTKTKHTLLTPFHQDIFFDEYAIIFSIKSVQVCLKTTSRGHLHMPV